ncbi:benzoate/H(+) symporter BenE family transporter [Mesorhizobium sp. BR1-1-16]|uniref:benzoate/H(+) symporter BenE family transporter n=1 Tax=Mesorhizobium sp. BR1-1-16 TaxID=2876653 RepID=UPI001CCD897E|nr:benzoate/H(+) symporter BenE family transporter [Mesorhizobium sp. BR1-1-16]MBZ9935512.1 benzoate/H(+) symporter BenE family transporter [Mesorhizobium sp. BR1-1-16]
MTLQDSSDHPQAGLARSGDLQPVLAGIIAAFVGYAGVFTVIIQGFIAVGATPAQAASGLLAICIVQGFLSILFSLRYKLPISIAWSTPGSVLFAATGMLDGGFPVAIGAFIGAGVLIIAAGMIKPFGKLVSSIPPVLASAMLAGILLGLCLAPAKAVATEPSLAIPVVLVWAIVGRIKRIWAVPAAVATAVVMIALHAPSGGLMSAHFMPDIAFVWPQFSATAMISLAVPLFIVTMAAQNLPGLAVLRLNGYNPPVSSIFVATGIGSIIAAPFCGHTLNLAAITAALCAGPDAHPHPGRRWIASLSAGVTYLVLGLGATTAAALLTIAPPVLIEAATGLALFGAFGGALAGAVAHPADRDAAMVTFVTAASGLSFLGIGAAFWGLAAGGAFMLLNKRWSR